MFVNPVHVKTKIDDNILCNKCNKLDAKEEISVLSFKCILQFCNMVSAEAAPQIPEPEHLKKISLLSIYLFHLCHRSSLRPFVYSLDRVSVPILR